jgi:hypothetical protein
MKEGQTKGWWGQAIRTKEPQHFTKYIYKKYQIFTFFYSKMPKGRLPGIYMFSDFSQDVIEDRA